VRKLPAINSFEEEEELETDHYQPPRKAGLALVVMAMGIILFGLISLYSTTSGTRGTSMLVKQAIWVFGGIAAAVAVNVLGYRRVLKLSPYLIVGGVVLLLAARFGPTVKGAHRWIRLPGGLGNIQPSEFAKLFLVMFLAYYIPSRQRQFSSSLKGMLVPIAVSGLMMGMVLLGKDLGTTALMGAVAWSVFFVAGARLRWILLPLPFVPAIPYYLFNFDPERWSRITSFLNPEAYQMGDGYQLWLSILALGSGGWFGLGFTQSRMKAEYLPESHTDFILSIVGEELGYIAMLAIILTYFVMACLAVYISVRAQDKEGSLLSFGITAMISFQAIINIGVVSGAFPTKGMSAPFISYGGSNMVMGLLAIGLLLSVANSHSQADEEEEPTPLNFEPPPPG